MSAKKEISWKSFDDRAHHAEWYRFADVLLVRVRHVNAPRLATAFRRYFGPLQIVDCDAREIAQEPAVDIVLQTGSSRMPVRTENGFFSKQRYKGGSWVTWVDHLDGDACKAVVSVSGLGRAMFVQAGLASLIRWKLGQLGFAWLHAACIVRDGRALVLAGPSGIGKSQIVLRAIRDGWQMVTDDHVLIGNESISGITTPVLLRGYGGTPNGVVLPAAIRRRRRCNALVRRLTLGRINLMVPYRPGRASLAGPRLLSAADATLCLLTRGASYAAQPVTREEASQTIYQSARHAGRFLDEMMSNGLRCESPVDMEAFWNAQRERIDVLTDSSRLCSASLPKPLDESSYQQLLSDIGL